MPFWKGLAHNSCVKTLANKKKYIRLNTPGVRLFNPLLVVLMWSSSEPLEWFTWAYMGQFHLPTLLFLCFDIYLGKNILQYTIPVMLNPAGRWRTMKRCFLPLKIWIPIWSYSFDYCKLFWVWIISCFTEVYWLVWIWRMISTLSLWGLLWHY